MANYVLLDRIELNNTATSVTFDNIPQSGYTDLKIVCSIRDTGAGTQNNVLFKINGVTTSQSVRTLLGQGSGTPSSYSDTPLYATGAVSNGATANTFSNVELYIPNYASTSAFKSVSIDTVTENNGAGWHTLNAGLYASNSAVTSIQFAPNGAVSFMEGSTFSLYGIAQVGTTPAVAPKADGGNVITTDGTYWYHAFLSNGTFTPQVGLTCDYLVVAGGGAGNWRSGNAGGGGGGGAGGLRSTVTSTGGGGSLESPISLAAATPYTVTVGAGGTASGTSDTNGTSGSNSVLASITALGGGYGSANGALTAGNGGSGGGAANAGSGTTTYGTGTSGQGYRGGNGNNSLGNGAGGGGGAAAAGADVTSNNGTAGGAGLYTALTDAVAIGQLSSTHYYVAGGGGGGAYTGGSGGAGGLGGGSAGTLNASTTNATANTGGGGGSVGSSTVGTRTGGNGGSGLVIIRYPVA